MIVFLFFWVCFEGIQTGLGLNWFKVDKYLRPDRCRPVFPSLVRFFSQKGNFGRPVWSWSCPKKAKKTRPDRTLKHYSGPLAPSHFKTEGYLDSIFFEYSAQDLLPLTFWNSDVLGCLDYIYFICSAQDLLPFAL